MMLRELIKDIPLSDTIRDDVLEIFEKFIFYTYDGKDIRLSAGRYNDKLFSYGKHSIIISPRFFASGKYIKDKTKKINTVDALDYRDKGLLDGDNSCVRAMTRDIKYFFRDIVKFETEVVIPIKKDIWLSLCSDLMKELKNNESLTKTQRNNYLKHINKSHLRLDFFNSEYGINIEHDGAYYHNSKLDEIRDKYLKTIFPDLVIIRIVDYVRNYKTYLPELYKLHDSIDEVIKRGKLDNPVIVDYRDEIFLEYYEKYFRTLSRISKKLNTGITIEELLDQKDPDLLSIDYKLNRKDKKSN